MDDPMTTGGEVDLASCEPVDTPSEPSGSAPPSGAVSRAVTSAVGKLASGGFRATFSIRPHGRFGCPRCRQEFDVADASIAAIHRIEGTDRLDPAVVVATTCSHCDAAGTAVLRFDAATSDPLRRSGGG